MNASTAKYLAKRLTKEQENALMFKPGQDRLCLVKQGMATWKDRTGYPRPVLSFTSLGFAVREIILKKKTK